MPDFIKEYNLGTTHSLTNYNIPIFNRNSSLFWLVETK